MVCWLSSSQTFFRKWIGTADKFVVKALCEIEVLPKGKNYLQ